jgi:hypothetical protein
MCVGVLKGRKNVVYYIYLSSICTVKLINRGCDICKDVRLEIPAIYCEIVEKV